MLRVGVGGGVGLYVSGLITCAHIKLAPPLLHPRLHLHSPLCKYLLSSWCINIVDQLEEGLALDVLTAEVDLGVVEREYDGAELWW